MIKVCVSAIEHDQYKVGKSKLRTLIFYGEKEETSSLQLVSETTEHKQIFKADKVKSIPLESGSTASFP